MNKLRKHVNSRRYNLKNEEKELEELERNSQKTLDDKIIVVCSALLGISISFFDKIGPNIQQHVINQILFIITIISLSITITYSVYSHYYSAKCFRKYNEQKYHNKDNKFNIEKASNRINELNLIQTCGFICSIISIMLLLLFLVNLNIWQFKIILGLLITIILLIIYYILDNSRITDKCLLKFYNLLLFITFFIGISYIWQIKTNNLMIKFILS